MTPQVDTGTDLEDELSIPASPPADVNNEMVALYMRAEVDSELRAKWIVNWNRCLGTLVPSRRW